MGRPASTPPSIDVLARQVAADVPELPHPLCVEMAREAVAAGDPASAVARGELLVRTFLRPVVNATGVILHTNLGRAPFPVVQPSGYRNLELDLRTGARGSRSAHAAALLARACGAEAALVVNNGAAAVLLTLAALAGNRSVLVSRGELVEIGGGFRIPEVLSASGARLVEVGTTNRTRLGDYLGVLEPDVAVVLKVHPSNYRLTGFTETVTVGELVTALADRPDGRTGRPTPVVADLGSGLLDARCPWLPGGPPAWLGGEPAVRQTLEAGAAVVTFSGDKLLGGPQAGVIAGDAGLVAACARHPLARALRPGGHVLAALQDVALSYLRRDVTECIPAWRMLTTPVEVLRRRAEALGVGEVVECAAVSGGGTLPGVEIPSAGVALVGDHTAALRTAETPVIARVVDGRTVCDLRTVDEDEDELLAKALTACIV